MYRNDETQEKLISVNGELLRTSTNSNYDHVDEAGVGAKEEGVDQKEGQEIDPNAATVRQKQYLMVLGVKIPKGLTKREASMLIDEALAGMN